MGGSSKSSSSSATSQTDNRRVIGQGGISAENSNVTVLDNGAVASSYDFARAISAGALTFALNSQSQTQAAQQAAANLVKDSYADAKGRGALTDYILIIALGVAAFIAYTAITKGKG